MKQPILISYEGAAVVRPREMGPAAQVPGGSFDRQEGAGRPQLGANSRMHY